MTANRKAIRLAAVAQLLAAQTAAESRVFANRVIPWKESELPAVSVYTRGEEVVQQTESPLAYLRTVDLVVEIVCDPNGDPVDDALDDLAGEVEAALFAEATLGGTVSELGLVRVEGPALDESGRTIVGSVRVVFGATYEYAVPLPELADDIEQVEIDWNLAPADQNVDAHDSIEVPVA